jgi:hypothetical protein
MHTRLGRALKKKILQKLNENTEAPAKSSAYATRSPPATGKLPIATHIASSIQAQV